MEIAIVGAGLAGLTLANQLTAHHNVTVFEKSRGAGGRMSTRYVNSNDEQYFQFDHGAQFFTARTREFKSFLKEFIEDGSVTPWKPRVLTLEKGKKFYRRDWFEPHYIASPKMNTLCKTLAKNLDVITGIKISQLDKQADGWYLVAENGQTFGLFDWVVLAIPSEQTLALLPSGFPDISSVEQVKQNACFALMLGFDKSLELNFDAAKVKNSVIDWICIDSTKRKTELERKHSYSMIVHTTNKWAEQNIDNDREMIEDFLLLELSQILGFELNPSHSCLHGWRYANTSNSLESVSDEHPPFLLDSNNKLAVCGDWCSTGTVEGAFTSGHQLASAILKL